MALDVHNFIAALQPDLYCAPKARKAVKDILRLKTGIDELDTRSRVAQVARPREPTTDDLDPLAELDPFDLPNFECPIVKHTLVHDAPGDSVEQVYFRLLDLLQKDQWEVIKLVDEVHASAASRLAPHLAEQAIRRQDHARRMLRDANQSVEGIAQLQFELQQCRQRLAAIASPAEGRSPEASAHVVSATIARSVDGSASGGDYEDRGQRLDSELGSEADETALRAQEARLLSGIQREENKLKLYAQWIAPLLPSPLGPTVQESASPDSVTGFDTALIKVVLLAQGAVAIQQEFDSGRLPGFLRRRTDQSSVPLVVAEFIGRTLPDQRTSRGFTHRGRVEITLTSYALTPQQVSLLQRLVSSNALALLLHALLPTDPQLANRIVTDLDGNHPGPGSAQLADIPSDSDPNPFLILLTSLQSLFRSVWRIATSFWRGQSDERVLQFQAALLASLRCEALYETLRTWISGRHSR
jgi:hypothetical protein